MHFYIVPVAPMPSGGRAPSEGDPVSLIWRAHLPALREADGWAGQFEFYVRMIAEAVWGKGGTAKDLDALFDRVIGQLRPHLDPSQLEALTSLPLCQLRHDILHCRWSMAYGKLGGKSNDPSVANTARAEEGEPLFATIVRAATGGAVPVPQTKTSDAGVLAWMAQMGAMSVFENAAKAFERACNALEVGITALSDDDLAE